mmetsp:Transcript_125557/g.313734  ORF Transcript_125557/g.313734 Transcript_125557/m.313734 type:complete len:242 (-) Transcript_125557:1032-1757(-)
MAKLITQHCVVAHSHHTKKVHAICHVLVLTVVIRSLAEVPTLCPLLNCLEREDLESSVDHVPKRAIHDEHVLTNLWGQVPTQALRNKDSIWVCLDRKCMVSPCPLSDNLLPRVDEELRVACGVVHGPYDRCACKLHGPHCVNGRVAISGQNGKVVAIEDACSALMLSLHEALFVTLSPHNGKAEEGGESLDGEAVAPWPKSLALPSLVAIVTVYARLTTAPALRIVFVLLVALHVHSEAAL